MKNFYIFLDIDGVLNNRNWIKTCVDYNLESKGYNKFIDPNSIKALNIIIESLEKYFNVIIVLSSLWKLNGVDKVSNLLQSQNLKISNKIFKTPDKYNRNRLTEIMSFMSQNQVGVNFLVIDDENLADYFPTTKFILSTGFDNNGLTPEQADNWLKCLNINILNK